MVDQFSFSAILEPALQGERNARGDLQFLTFPLADDTLAMLPVAQLAEVLTLSAGQVVPIPDMAAWVLGVYNWRGTILWVIDLAQFLGMPPIYTHTSVRSTYKMMVAQTSQPGSSQPLQLGLAVYNVEDMFWCSPEDIASAPSATITPGLAPFLSGYAQNEQDEILMALDAQAIFDRALSG